MHKGGQPVAFEVPANESIVKKHPPKRLAKLEDIQQNVSITHETIEEKQAEAERRRKEILNNRVQSAKRRTSQQSARSRSRSRPATAGSAGGSDISGGGGSDHE
ncbi:unnamed protein product [Notodromas monacha]|uniref:Uncharacterized protein n=1 Tax=Notodromas monacha TaxID=399045 RepID=A0A7R9GB24_9CRUS|nr:unnamed protein product [Notodromas monacha]CAG0915871.1 unnamed protein product [Notodromas monacha]